MINFNNYSKELDKSHFSRGLLTGRADNGRDVACLVFALPIWPWLAHLAPFLDDVKSDTDWPQVIQIYASNLRELTDTDSERLALTCKRIFVSEAWSHVGPDETSALATIREIVALIDRALAGDKLTEEDWNEAADACSYPMTAVAAHAVNTAQTAAWADAGVFGAIAAAKAAVKAAPDRAEALDRIRGAVLEAFEAVIAEKASAKS